MDILNEKYVLSLQNTKLEEILIALNQVNHDMVRRGFFAFRGNDAGDGYVLLGRDIIGLMTLYVY